MLFFFVQNINDFVVAFHLVLLAGDFLKQCRVFLQVAERLLLLFNLVIVILDLLFHLAELAVTSALFKDIILVEKHDYRRED